MIIEKNRINPPGFGVQQTEAINMLNRFMASNDLEFTLSGYAGTGKTFLLKYFIDKVCNVSVCPTAPTHKAVRVIEKVLNRKGKTLQSLHGLRPNLDLANFSITNPQFDPRGIDYIKNYKLVIIDEASMITESIHELNLRRAKQYGTKIIYVGDPLQLRAVEKNKTANTSNPISKAFSSKNQYTLTEIMRQEEGNPLLELFPLIRADVLNSTKSFLTYIFTNREKLVGDIGYQLLNQNDFNTLLFEHFSLEHLKTNLDYARVLAYTNERVKYLNSLIRSNIIEHNNEVLTSDDILTAYTTIVDEFNQPIITNSEDYYIDSIRPYINAYEIKTYAINLKSVWDNSISQTLQIVDHTDESFKTYYKILNHLHSSAINAHQSERSKRWVDYYKFKESMLSMITFRLSESNGGAIVKKDIDYGYAITTHKAQGSTFDNIFIDLQDIVYYITNGKLKQRYDINLVNRLIYVALSRASNKVIMKL